MDKYIIYAPKSNELNVLDYHLLEKFVLDNRIDIILHTAHYNKPKRVIRPDYEVEYDMRLFLNVMKVSDYVEKVIHFGSGAEFDKRNDLVEVSEEAFGKSIPDFPYGISKYISNMLTYYKDNIINLRLFGVFGKYEDWETYFVSNICCKAVFDLPLTLRQDCYFDYIYIDDLVRIIHWFIDNTSSYKEYNVCSGNKILLSSIIDIVKEVSGKTELKSIILNDGYNREYSGSNRRLMSELKGFEFEPIERSINKLYQWYLKNTDEVDINILKKSR